MNMVPSEVTLPISVLNVQPDDVVGDVVKIESSINRLDISLAVVVPATLVIPQGKERRQSLES